MSEEQTKPGQLTLNGAAEILHLSFRSPSPEGRKFLCAVETLYL